MARTDRPALLHGSLPARAPTYALNRWFTYLLRRRGRRGLFSRHPLQDRYVGIGRHEPLPDELLQALERVATDTPAAALARLKSHPDGLSRREASARLARHGPNEVEHDRTPPAWRRAWHCYRDPFNLLLSALALVSWLSEGADAAAVIGAIVVLSTGMRFVQEGRSGRAVDRLRALVSNRASVQRQESVHPPHRPRIPRLPHLPLLPHRVPSGSAGPAGGTSDPGSGPADGTAQTAGTSRVSDIPLRELVPGDLVHLAAGDMVPADCRLLTARDLFVAQAALTGEALPVEKFADARGTAGDTLRQTNLLFMGTNVVSGSGLALVVATGAQTGFGAIAERLGRQDDTPDAFQAGVNAVSWLLIRFAAVMAPLVLLLSGWRQGDWVQAALFALSLAVGLTPELLPMIVTTTLAQGALALSRRRVVVKRLDAVHHLGAMDTLCTDKTGTLTQDRLVLGRHVDAFGQSSQAVLRATVLNSRFQTGLRSLLDRAVLAHAAAPGEPRPEEGWQEGWRLVDEIPFDFTRRRLSVVVEPAQGGGPRELICKGALEEVLAACTQVRQADGQDTPLDAALRARVLQAALAMNDEGLRVVTVAVKALPAGAEQPDDRPWGVADEAGLTLLGHVAFVDPPKDSAAPALRQLQAHGIEVKVLTGDHERVAAQVCRLVGIDPGTVVTGPALDALDDAALAPLLAQHRVFARLNPLHKERLVRALRAQGRIVGFLGDGINDAPALRAADVGVSVDSAVDIAREAADVVLLEKSLTVLADGVVEGRRTFCNLLKYIRTAASSNFGNVLSVLVASATLPFLPMLPLHLLVQNLLYDVAQTAVPFDRVDAAQLARPLRWNPAGIGRFMLCFGPVSSVFDLAAFAVLWFALGADSPAEQALFQTGWFVVGLLTQTLVVHLMRSPGLPWADGGAAAPLLATTTAVIALGLWLPASPLGPLLKMTPLPPAFHGWLAALLLGYALAASTVKHWVVRRHGWD
jgi:Mg2+-importing ATPase